MDITYRCISMTTIKITHSKVPIQIVNYLGDTEVQLQYTLSPPTEYFVVCVDKVYFPDENGIFTIPMPTTYSFWRTFAIVNRKNVNDSKEISIEREYKPKEKKTIFSTSVKLVSFCCTWVLRARTPYYTLAIDSLGIQGIYELKHFFPYQRIVYDNVTFWVNIRLHSTDMTIELEPTTPYEMVEDNTSDMWDAIRDKLVFFEERHHRVTVYPESFTDYKQMEEEDLDEDEDHVKEFNSVVVKVHDCSNGCSEKCTTSEKAEDVRYYSEDEDNHESEDDGEPKPVYDYWFTLSLGDLVKTEVEYHKK